MTPPSGNSDRGEYGLGPEPGPRPNRHRPRPIRVAKLDYERHDKAVRYVVVPAAVQFIIGMLSPFAYAAIVGVLIAICPVPAPIVALAIPGFAFLVLWIWHKTSWTGFVPGVLTTIILLPVIGVVFCGIILSNVRIGGP
jgi:hypothetical protein